MWQATEGWRPYRRRKTLELGITPLIDIVFLLLLFFMLTSRFVLQEGIEVQLPETDKTHSVASQELKIIYIKADGSLFFMGQSRTFNEMDQYLASQSDQFLGSSFEILSDRKAPIQTMVSLLEMLRERGAGKVTIGTVQATPSSKNR